MPIIEDQQLYKNKAEEIKKYSNPDEVVRKAKEYFTPLNI